MVRLSLLYDPESNERVVVNDLSSKQRFDLWRDAAKFGSRVVWCPVGVLGKIVQRFIVLRSNRFNDELIMANTYEGSTDNLFYYRSEKAGEVMLVVTKKASRDSVVDHNGAKIEPDRVGDVFSAYQLIPISGAFGDKGYKLGFKIDNVMISERLANSRCDRGLVVI